MNRDDAAKITRDRLEAWMKQLRVHTATPVLMLAVGHGESSGALHLCATENTPDEHILYFLEFAQAQIAARLAGTTGVGNLKVVLPTDGKDGAP